MKTKLKHEGYLLIDNRHAPGPSLADAHAAGLTNVAIGGVAWESATITCSHCGVIVVLNPERTRARGYCRKCDAYVCDNPMCNSDCKPFALVLDEAEEAARKLLTF